MATQSALVLCVLLAAVASAAEPDNPPVRRTVARANALVSMTVIGGPGRLVAPPGGWRVGLGNAQLIAIGCWTAPDAEPEDFWVRFELEEPARGFVRFWYDQQQTREILPHSPGTSLPYDMFRPGELPAEVWIESRIEGLIKLNVEIKQEVQRATPKLSRRDRTAPDHF